MSTPASPSTPPAGDDRKLVVTPAGALSFEDRLHRVWQNYRGAVTGMLVVVLLAILAKGGWDYYAAQREISIEQAYAAATTPEQLKTFATTHAGHSLAGVAYLRIADQAYAAGKSTDAIAAYEQAATVLKTRPFSSRVKLGLAMAKLAAGKPADAEVALKTLSADLNETKALRAEAAYQLTVLAADANRPEDVKKYAEQVMAIDPTSPWTQRAVAILARTPSAGTVAPAVSLPPGTK